MLLAIRQEVKGGIVALVPGRGLEGIVVPVILQGIGEGLVYRTPNMETIGDQPHNAPAVDAIHLHVREAVLNDRVAQ